MADDFIVFLVAGLIIIAVLIAGFMLYPWTPEDKCCPEREILDFEGALIVGQKDINTYRPFELGYFNADFASGTSIYTLGNRAIKNGVLFGNAPFRYHIESRYVEDARIKFTVTDTNNYGPLMIVVNGYIIEKRHFTPGEYTILVPKQLLSDSMYIEIFAESSGLKIWAPSYYELADIRLVITGFTQNSFAHAFFITEEYDMFNEGRIELTMDKNKGDIVILMNDIELYSGPITDIEALRFDRSYLRYGQNYVTIMATENSEFAGYAKMMVFYKTIHPARLEIPFSLNQSEYDSMARGVISLDVVQVIKSGGLTVKIVKDNQVTYNAYAGLGVGSYQFDFDKANVRTGEHMLLVDAVDNGVFAVKNVAVKV